jgi:hypothetical protein
MRLDRHRRLRTQKPPGGGFLEAERDYFEAASLAAVAAAGALAIADESAAEAAIEPEAIAPEASAAGGVTAAGVVAGAGGVTTVSSFLLQAANDIAATNETNNSAFFIACFLTPMGRKFSACVEPSSCRAPAMKDKGKREPSGA